MTKLDFIENLLEASGLNNNELELVSNTDTSSEYSLRCSDSIPLIPTDIKSRLRDTSYSEDLMDSDNNNVLFKFDKVDLNNQLVNLVVNMEYVPVSDYIIKLQILNYVKYDNYGNEYFD